MSLSAETTPPAVPASDPGPATSSTAPADRTGPMPAAPRQEQARKIVRRNVYWALGAGLVPVPIVDFFALTAVQVKMLKELSDHYKVPFFEDKAKSIIGSLVASLGGLSLAAYAAKNLFKVVPLAGLLVSAFGGAVFGGALTLATGNLFVMHYESGGTLLNFDADKMRAHFKQEFDKAKETVKQMLKEEDASARIQP